jgi:hypothetical protein
VGRATVSGFVSKAAFLKTIRHKAARNPLKLATPRGRNRTDFLTREIGYEAAIHPV